MKSTIAQLKEFKSSFVWQDLRLAILTRLSGVRNDLEIMPPDISADEDVVRTANLRGQAAELRFLAELPEELITQIERGDLKWQTEQQEEEQEPLAEMLEEPQVERE